MLCAHILSRILTVFIQLSISGKSTYSLILWFFSVIAGAPKCVACIFIVRVIY
jgi:uncharacterized membrane protein YjdF